MVSMKVVIISLAMEADSLPPLHQKRLHFIRTEKQSTFPAAASIFILKSTCILLSVQGLTEVKKDHLKIHSELFEKK